MRDNKEAIWLIKERFPKISEDSEEFEALYQMVIDASLKDLNILKVYTSTIEVVLAANTTDYVLNKNQILFGKRLVAISVPVASALFTQSPTGNAMVSQTTLNSAYITLVDNKRENYRDGDWLGFYFWDGTFIWDKPIFPNKPVTDWSKCTLNFPDNTQPTADAGKSLIIRAHYLDI